MLQKSQIQPNTAKKTFSYEDIIQMKSDTIYRSVGKTIDPQLPNAPRATFGKQQRSSSNKKFLGKQLEKDLAGKQGIGPAGYLPPRFTLTDGTLVQGKDTQTNTKYDSVPSYSIGKQQRVSGQTIRYEYMKHQNDNLQIDTADLKRKNSSPSILIGTARRFSQERLDKVTPGPTYDSVQKPEQRIAPKFTIASKHSVKGQDYLIPTCSTTTLVGPGSYFQKVKKSHSTSSLSRVPYDSNIKRQPTVSFSKAPRTLREYRNSVDETYDIKRQFLVNLSKTLMSQYDFQYDGGKGYHSGKSFMKKNIISSMQNPLERNKMGSFTINRASRQKEQEKRGFFKNTMTQVPQSVRISIPKF